MSPSPRKKDALAAAEAALRTVMLSYPEATEEFPWEHRTAKVKGKMFCVLVRDETGLSVTVKLPTSNAAALMMPFATPTGYGLGKSGWVSCAFKPGDEAPVALLTRWIDESYRAVAPKKLVEALDGKPAPARKPARAKKPAKPRARTARARSGA
ncbi:MmcQ/YjbR family DNA-binding protein [Myxococcaceae bacterium GXIMD 01537]